MRREASEESSRARSFEVAVGESARGAQTQEAEVRHGDRMPGPAYGFEHVMAKTIPVGQQRTVEAPVCGCIRPQLASGGPDVTLQHDGGAIIQWVREFCGRPDPPQAGLLQRQGGEEGRGHGHGVHGGPQIVPEAG